MGKFLKKINIEEAKAYIASMSEDTKIYFGSDSEQFKVDGKWYADYTTVIVVHKDGCRGAKIFGQIERDIDYDQRKDRPKMRMMNEAYKIVDLYLEMTDDELEERHAKGNVEIHLDINPDEQYGSYCAVKEAIGYVQAMCNVIPFVKPEAFAASYAADRLKEIVHYRENTSIVDAQAKNLKSHETTARKHKSKKRKVA